MISAKELEKLAKLKEKGIITEKEFNAKKKEFLKQSVTASDETTEEKTEEITEEKASWSGSKIGGYVFGAIIVVVLFSYFFGDGLVNKSDMFYENGIQYFTIDSEEGQKCYEAVSKQAKWGMQIIKPEYFMFNWSKVIEKDRRDFDVKVDECKMEKYVIYGANSFTANNAFGATRRVYMVCVKNNMTNQYSALYTDDDPFDSMEKTAQFYSGTPCEQYDIVAKNIEQEASLK